MEKIVDSGKSDYVKFELELLNETILFCERI